MPNSNSYYEIKRKFQETYVKNLLPFLKTQETERKQKLFYAVLIGAIAAVCTVFIIYYCIIASSKDTDFRIVIFPIAIAWILISLIKKDFESKIKMKIMPSVCKCFNDLTWRLANYRYPGIFQESSLTESYNKCDFDDIFEGRYKELNFDIIDGRLCQVSRSSKGGRSETTIFHGVLIVIDANKKFKNHTVIRPNTIFHCSPAHHLKHTELEDVIFEKKYDVYTDDEVEARYLITTSFMERLNNIEKVFKAKEVSCAFYKGQIIIGLNTGKDMFSICNLTKSLEDTEQFFNLFNEMISIYKLIDHLKLEHKIGL